MTVPRRPAAWGLCSALLPSVSITWTWRQCQSLSHVRLLATPRTVTSQAPPFVGFFRQEWIGLPFPSPEELPDPGIKPGSPTLQADSLPSEPPGKPSYLWFTFIFLSSLLISISSIHGIFQARVLEWIAISFSRGSSRPRNRSWVSLFAGRHCTI